MLVYIYQASLWCEDCGQKIRKELDARSEAPADPGDERTYDSDDYPKGPTDEGESDSPSHCNGCNKFLESKLTSEGERWLVEYYTQAIAHDAVSPAMLDWAEFYDVNLIDVLKYNQRDEPADTDWDHLSTEQQDGAYLGLRKLAKDLRRDGGKDHTGLCLAEAEAFDAVANLLLTTGYKPKE